MAMTLNSVSESISATYSASGIKQDKLTQTDKKTAASADKKNPTAAEAVSKDKKAAEAGATYEKSEEPAAKATYSINKMSAEERAALVNQLKADQANRESQLTSLVSKMMGKQAGTFGIATDDMWKFLASGEFTVDAATKAQAQEDISEDGYWGVKQTSQRLFDFASALAGDDVEAMKKMQSAMMKGFDQATKTWGRELPQISHDTIAAANKLFDDYYASKQEIPE